MSATCQSGGVTVWRHAQRERARGVAGTWPAVALNRRGPQAREHPSRLKADYATHCRELRAAGTRVAHLARTGAAPPTRVDVATAQVGERGCALRPNASGLGRSGRAQWAAPSLDTRDQEGPRCRHAHRWESRPVCSREKRGRAWAAKSPKTDGWRKRARRKAQRSREQACGHGPPAQENRPVPPGSGPALDLLGTPERDWRKTKALRKCLALRTGEQARSQPGRKEHARAAQCTREKGPTEKMRARAQSLTQGGEVLTSGCAGGERKGAGRCS